MVYIKSATKKDSKKIIYLLNTECIYILIKIVVILLVKGNACSSFKIILTYWLNILLKIAILFSTAEQTYIPTWYSVP